MQTDSEFCSPESTVAHRGSTHQAQFTCLDINHSAYGDRFIRFHQRSCFTHVDTPRHHAPLAGLLIVGVNGEPVLDG